MEPVIVIVLLILIVAAPIMALVALYRQRDYRQHAYRIQDLEVRVEHLRKKLDDRSADGARLQEPEIRVDDLRKEPEARSTGMSSTGMSSAGMSSAGGPSVEPPVEDPVEGPLAEETAADPIAASSAHEPEGSTATREPEGLSWAGAPLPEEEPPTERDAESELSAAPAGPYLRSGLHPRESEYASKSAVNLPSIDWEQWVGVRGAAVVGGISLVLAGLFFLQYAITHGWFGPGLRVVTAVVVGIACILVRPTLHERGTPPWRGSWQERVSFCCMAQRGPAAVSTTSSGSPSPSHGWPWSRPSPGGSRSVTIPRASPYSVWPAVSRPRYFLPVGT